MQYSTHAGGLLGGRAAPFDVDRQRRLGADPPAERDVFVGSEVAGLGLVLPRQVRPRRPAIPRADTPDPVIVLRDVAPGPTKEGGPERLDALEDVRPHAVGCITRFERDLVHPEAPGSREEDGEPRERIRTTRPKREWVLPPVARHLADLRFGIHLAAADVLFERDRHRPCRSRRLEPEIAVVGDTGSDGKPDW